MNTTGTFKFALRYGLITGGALVVYSLLLYAIGMMENRYLSFLAYVIFIVGMILSVKDYRDKAGGGFITFGRAFSVGFYTALIAAVISAIYTYLFFSFFDTSMLQEMLVKGEEAIRDRYPDWSDEQVDQAMAMSRKFMSPPAMMAMGFLWNLIAGVILSVIIAAIMKKEGSPFIATESKIAEDPVVYETRDASDASAGENVAPNEENR